jgi:hypothetical protein
MNLYADVILPLPVPGMFTYRIGDGELSRVAPGMRQKEDLYGTDPQVARHKTCRLRSEGHTIAA